MQIRCAHRRLIIVKNLPAKDTKAHNHVPQGQTVKYISGKAEMSNTIQRSGEKKLTLLLLCWLFGLFAVHRLYTGKYHTAGIQLLAWALIGVLALLRFEIIPAVLISLLGMWWIIDIMLIIMGKFTDKMGKKIEDWV